MSEDLPSPRRDRSILTTSPQSLTEIIPLSECFVMARGFRGFLGVSPIDQIEKLSFPDLILRRIGCTNRGHRNPSLKSTALLLVAGTTSELRLVHGSCGPTCARPFFLVKASHVILPTILAYPIRELRICRACSGFRL